MAERKSDEATEVGRATAASPGSEETLPTATAQTGTSDVRPLGDIRVIAIEQYGAGPFATLNLADLGAEVIKIEDPSTGGDVGRSIPPFNTGEDSLFFQSFNRNKLSMDLDIRTAAGREVFEDLVKVSNVVFSNLRGDVPAKLKIRYDDLQHLNREVVCCSLSGFGMTGPRASEPGYDYNIQGLAGWMSVTGEPDGPPTKSGLSLVDFGGGQAAAGSIMAGLWAAKRDGRGMDIDMSLFENAISMITYQAPWHLNGGFVPARRAQSAHPSVVPFQNFETADGWIVVSCPKEKFWQRLTSAIDMPQLADDPRYATVDDRRANEEDLLELLSRTFRLRLSEEWVEELTAAGVPCSPVNDIPAALRDPQTRARGIVLGVAHPDWETVWEVATPMRVGETKMAHRRAPTRNEHADYVLGDLLGYDATTRADLELRNAFGARAEQEGAPAPGEG